MGLLSQQGSRDIYSFNTQNLIFKILQVNED